MIIIANWKTYLTIEQSRNLAASAVKWWNNVSNAQAKLVLCPSFLAVHDVARQLHNSKIKLGVQELSLESELGAYTGQTPAQHLKECNVDYAIIGHSEMRQFFNVTDQMVANQLRVAFSHGIVPIVCIGETKEERNQGKTDHTIVGQLQTIFSRLDLSKKSYLIAYEPRWAIGKDIPVEPNEVKRINNLILHTMKEYNQNPLVLYGGGVNSTNVRSFLELPNVSGVLIGGSSSKPDSLKAIIEMI